MGENAPKKPTENEDKSQERIGNFIIDKEEGAISEAARLADETLQKAQELKEKGNEKEKERIRTDVINEAEKLIKKGEAEKALAIYAEFLKIDGKIITNALRCAENIINKGFILMKQDKKYDEAIEQFNHVLKVFPSHGRAMLYAAQCHYAKMRVDEKMEGPPNPNKQKNELNKKEFEDILEKGIKHLDKGEFKAARINLYVLNSQNPGNPIVVHALSIACAGLAKNELEKAKSLSKESLPELIKSLKYTKEAHEYASQSGKNSEESVINVWNIFKEAQATINRINTLTNLEISNKDKAKLFKANADLLASIYPQRKSSLWDFYKVDLNGDKRNIIEEKDGIPVRLNRKERFVSMQGGFSVMRKLESFMNICANKELKQSMGKLIELLYTYKEKGGDGFRTPNAKIREAISNLKIKIAEAIAKGERSPDGKKDKEWKDTMEEVLELIKNDNFLLQLAKLAPSMKQAEQIEHIMKQILPEKEYDEMAIDPKPELNASLMAIDYYLDALELDPENTKTYQALIELLEKIHFFEGGSIEITATSPQERVKQLKTRIKTTIGLKTSEMPRLESRKRSLIGGITGLDDYVVTEFLTPLGLIPKKVEKVKRTKKGKRLRPWMDPEDETWPKEVPGYERKEIDPGIKRKRGFPMHVGLTRPYISNIDVNAPVNPTEPYIPTGSQALEAGGVMDTSGYMMIINLPPAEMMEYIIWKLGK